MLLPTEHVVFERLGQNFLFLEEQSGVYRSLEKWIPRPSTEGAIEKWRVGPVRLTETGVVSGAF